MPRPVLKLSKPRPQLDRLKNDPARLKAAEAKRVARRLRRLREANR